MPPINSLKTPPENPDTKKTKSLIKQAKARIRKGENKWNIFNEFRSDINPKILGANIANIPDTNLSKKYNVFNIILIVCWIITLLHNLFSVASLIPQINFSVAEEWIPFLFGTAVGIGIDILFIYLFLIKYGWAYKMSFLFLLISLFNNLKNYLFEQNLSIELLKQFPLIIKLWIIGGFLLSVFMIIFGFILGNKMFPYIKLMPSNRKSDINGVPVFTTEPKKESNTLQGKTN